MKRKDKIFLIALFTVFIPAMVIFIILDWKISSSFKMSKNWFTLSFDAFGSYITIVPTFFVLLHWFNFLLHHNHHFHLSRISWLATFTTLFISISAYVFFMYDLDLRKGFFLGTSASYKNDAEVMLFLIFVLVFIAYTIYLARSKFMSSSEMARFLAVRSFQIALYVFFINMTTFFLKQFFGRPRPREIIDFSYHKDFFHYAFEPCFANYRSNSFPSGHVTGAMSIFGLLYLVPKNQKSLKMCLSIFFGALVVATAISRVWIHAHWSTDVTFAAMHSLLWYYFTPKIADSIMQPRNKIRRELH